jgi:hypothetical protein
MKSRQGLALFVVWSAVAASAFLTLLAPKAPESAAKEGVGAKLLSLSRSGF